MRKVELAPDEKAMIAAARDAVTPTEIQRARVRKSLDAKIAAGVAAPALATSAALATLLKIGAGIAIAAALGTGVVYFVAPRLSVPTTNNPAVQGSRARETTRPAPVEEPPEIAPVAAPQAPASSDLRPTHARSPARRREASPSPAADLAGELGLLTQVSAATKQGNVAFADELLRSYDQRFPSGQLGQERAAAGILVHCAAGRVQAARQDARRFLDRWPRSPLVARIQGSCAVDSKGP